MRILALHSYYRLRGGEDVVFDAETAMLESFGHEVIRVTRQNDDLASDGRWKNARNTIWNRELAAEVRALVTKHDIQVTHVHNTFPAMSPSVIQAAYDAGSATVMTMHNFRVWCARAVCFRDQKPCFDCVGKTFGWPGIQHGCFHDSSLATGIVSVQNWFHRSRKTYKKFLNRAIAPTQYVAQRYRDSGFPIAPLVVKPHFVEMDADPSDDVSQGGQYALFVGRLSEEKGVRTLLDAWAQLDHARYRDPPQLRIIGEGPMQSLLQDPPPGITYLGKMSQQHVYDAMADARMLLLPSHCAESFGRVAVESFARGTPVVCSDQGGQAEVVTTDVGRHFSSGDAAGLASVVDGLWNDEETLQAMRLAARAEYESKYTAEINHGQLMSIYETALTDRHPDRFDFPSHNELHDSTTADHLPDDAHAGDDATIAIDVPHHDQLGRRASAGSTARRTAGRP